MKNRIFFALIGIACALAVAPIGKPITERHELRKSQEGEFEPDYMEIQDYLNFLRAYPYTQIDTKAYVRYAYRKKPTPINFDGDGAISPPGGAAWQYVGPIDNPGAGGATQTVIYNGPGPVSGRVNAIGLAPGKICIASPGGGVHESTDGGATWTPLSDDWATLKTSAVAYKPGDPNTMLVGTGDYKGGEPTGALGIMKGTNGGGGWAFTTKGDVVIDGRSVSKIVFDPENPSIVVATTGRGAGDWKGKIIRSINSGDTWTAIVGPDRPWNDVVCSALSPATGRRIYYAAGDGSGNILMRSMDKGKTWKGVTPPVPDSGDPLNPYYIQSCDVAVSPYEPETVYFMCAINFDIGGGNTARDIHIYKSTNGGNTWVEKVSPTALNGFPDGYNLSQWTYDWFLACGSHFDFVTLQQTDDVYAGFITVAHSADGGDNWIDEGHTYNPEGGKYWTHNDQHCMVPLPGNPAQLWLGNDTGIVFVDEDPFTNRCSFDPSKNKNLFITQFYHGAWDVEGSRPDYILGGTQDNGSPWSNASPPAWQICRNLGDGVGAVIGRGIANAHTYQYTSRVRNNDNQGFNFLSTKDFWTNELNNYVSGTGQTFVTFPPIAGDPNTPNILYSASTRLWQYDITRTEINTTVTAGANSATQTVGSTAGMFIGERLFFFRNNANNGYRFVQSITNATKVVLTAAINTTVGAWGVFSDRWAETTGGQNIGSTTAIAVAKGDSLRIYTGNTSGNVWMSTDAGSTAPNWTNVGANLPNRIIGGIAVDPTNKDKIWVALQGATGEPRVFKTDVSVGPINWTGYGVPNGIPDINCNCITVDPDNPTKNVFIGTDLGLYYSGNGGATWQHANNIAANPMPANVKVTDVQVVGTGAERTLNVSTFGRGIWRVPVVTLY